MSLTRVVDKTKQKQNRIYYLRNLAQLSIPFSGIFMCMNGNMCCYYVTMYKTQHGVYDGFFSQIPMNIIDVWDTGIDFVRGVPLEINYLDDRPPLLIKEMVSFDGANNTLVVKTRTNAIESIVFNNDTIKSFVPLTAIVYMLKAKDQETIDNDKPAVNAESAFDAEAASMFAEYFGGKGKKKSRKNRRNK